MPTAVIRRARGRVGKAIALGMAMAASADSACGTNSASGRPGDVAGQPPGSGGGGPAGGGSAKGGNAPGNGGGAGIATVPLDASLGGDASANSLSITPSSAVFEITVTNGTVQTVSLVDAGGASVQFQAVSQGVSVSGAKWSTDRGELGTLDIATGQFTPNGHFSGVATISALYGGTTATATVTVRLHMIQNGGSSSPDGGSVGVGGVGGVGGEGPGGAVDDATRGRLTGPATSPTTPAELGLLYPYDRTVWPRGLLPPLVQWQTTHGAAAAYLHLTEKNFEFEGFYAGARLLRQPIDPLAWRAALNGNGGDLLHLEVKIAAADGVIGPVAEDWIVAPGVLRGTVYYDSYNTRLATQQPGAPSAAAVLAIRPGMTDPVLALPASAGQCIVCHTVADDGSTLFAQISNPADPTAEDYSNGASYDLRNGGALIASYVGNAPDGTTNDRKFLWSGLWKDGTFALQSVGHTQEHYGGNAAPATLASQLFRRNNGNALVGAGFDGVLQEAVTPAFSRDGTRVAFNYWTGSAGPRGGNGHTLDVMDFACGPAAVMTAGAPSCGSFTFSNLRRLYTNADVANGYVGWPAWLPDSSGIVFHNTTQLSSMSAEGDSPISTWHGAKAQLWFVDVPKSSTDAARPLVLAALNGDGPDGNSILPRAAGVLNHADDDRMNYEPTVNPIPSGGYSWVVFTSRRMYGNVAAGDPYAAPSNADPVPKKLWVAAIDLHPTPGKDPSHPAFYLPGQELLAGNMRGFWVVDPCRADGTACESGDECCSGYCRPDASGALVCGGPSGGCAKEFERCVTSADCCDTAQGFECINSVCTRPPTIVR